MQCDVDPCDVTGCDIVFGSDITGLVIYQCQNWALDENHGGTIGETRIFDGKDQVFGRLSLEDNQAGVVYYYKTFWKNTGETWPDAYAQVTTNASAMFARESVTVCLGTPNDDMNNKPNDEEFGLLTDYVTAVETDGDIPVWIRQEVTAGGSTAARGQDIAVQIMLVAVE